LKSHTKRLELPPLKNLQETPGPIVGRRTERTPFNREGRSSEGPFAGSGGAPKRSAASLCNTLKWILEEQSLSPLPRMVDKRANNHPCVKCGTGATVKKPAPSPNTPQQKAQACMEGDGLN